MGDLVALVLGANLQGIANPPHSGHAKAPVILPLEK
jgi:hypothetical protein